MPTEGAAEAADDGEKEIEFLNEKLVFSTLYAAPRAAPLVPLPPRLALSFEHPARP